MTKTVQTGISFLLLVSVFSLMHFSVYSKTKLSAAENTCTTEFVSKFLKKETLKDCNFFSLKKVYIENIISHQYLDFFIHSYLATYIAFSRNIEKPKLCILYKQYKVYC
ncbi:hypothetical protein FLAV_01578 [Flavobacteriales bacterium]|nr:hypothetical protein FLAV_01578 [Flavobacteriales bacterium]